MHSTPGSDPEDLSESLPRGDRTEPLHYTEVGNTLDKSSLPPEPENGNSSSNPS